MVVGRKQYLAADTIIGGARRWENHKVLIMMEKVVSDNLSVETHPFQEVANESLRVETYPFLEVANETLRVETHPFRRRSKTLCRRRWR